jgi:hypothetical protein
MLPETSVIQQGNGAEQSHRRQSETAGRNIMAMLTRCGSKAFV